MPPGAAIGILGGGQLGRMMALAGRTMGYRFITLDPTEDSPGGQVSDHQIVANYDDRTGAADLAAHSNVITYEFENVDAGTAAILEKESFVPQGSELLRITQNRIREKTTLNSIGIPVAPFQVINSVEEAEQAAHELGLPLVMKTATGGYDGKGQKVIDTLQEVRNAFEQLSVFKADLILEKFIPFTKEISVIAARSLSGEIRTFPAAENVHRRNILHLSIVPARIPDTLEADAKRLAEEIADKLDVIGLIAVEMFVTQEGHLLVNELAPRPHNSGHYTMDACVTSQFEQHIRAICGLPLGSTRLLTPVVMVNVLGEHLQPLLERVNELPDMVKLHLYGKKESKPQRKMGHLNVPAQSVEEALQIIDTLEIWTTTEVGQ
ncbi:5-(carboxyamino)imidazole ribonucleotide synthase [Aneurinibacillus sp. Ricciae_BoGa-3]|uniref:5-(carboxyamino)imidazole ribonucleotide synthase n=1 Tax=Aneurinibacillus sp. Ricciae_BoGa-3 TaxID=3022697 RepID=UPI002341C466|nr:5-(carboxyamino)imidazole ribonucleotide synthase [Aneurinibacillus sp. Ricciae_BoGa-3]WCK55017.1 5-(carboxyamino)imidazole ribonucleotide synthase [Aneurinibacillus sp. Ricciae_BoGa-3]